MGLVTKQHTFSAGGTIKASEHNDNFDDIYNQFNGNIDNENIKAAASIDGTKINLVSVGAIGTTTPGAISGTNIGASGTIAAASVDGNPTYVSSAAMSGTNSFAFSTGTNLKILPGANLTISGWSNIFTSADPAAVEYDQDDLTTDGNWHTLDLSSKIGAANTPTNAVLLHCSIQDASTGIIIRFRKNGNSNAVATPLVRTQVANLANDATLLVPTDESGAVQFKTSNSVIDLLNVSVVGWLK